MGVRLWGPLARQLLGALGLKAWRMKPHLRESEKCESFEHMQKKMFSIIVNVTSRADPQEAVLAFKKCSWGFLYFFAGSPLLGRAGGREPAVGGRRLSLGHALTRSCEVSHALVEVGVTASNRTFFSPRGTCTLWARTES